MGRLKALLTFLIVMALVYGAYIFGPPYFNNYQFQDDLTTEVRFMQNSGKTDEEIKDDLIKKALDYSLFLKPEQIRISRMNKTITVEVNYTVHVEVPGYSTDLQFHPKSTNTLAL